MQPSLKASERELPRLRFSCGHCRQDLSVDEAQAGIGGPCPRCGQWVVAPFPVKPPPDPDFFNRVGKIPAKGGVKHAANFKSGHLMPDSMVDRGEQNRREVFVILRILACCILVIGACVAAYWFMQKNMIK